MFYVLSKEMYTKPYLMRNIQTVKRYVDNGGNTFSGTKRMFSKWSIKVNSHFKLDKKVREELNTSPDKISVVSTFDIDHQIVEVVEKHVVNLSQCNVYCIGTSLPF